jgi:hypothetical protein
VDDNFTIPPDEKVNIHFSFRIGVKKFLDNGSFDADYYFGLEFSQRTYSYNDFIRVSDNLEAIEPVARYQDFLGISGYRLSFTNHLFLDIYIAVGLRHIYQFTNLKASNSPRPMHARAFPWSLVLAVGLKLGFVFNAGI